MDFLCGIGNRLSRRSQGCLQHSILDVSAAYFVVARGEMRDREMRDREMRDREMRDREMRDREMPGDAGDAGQTKQPPMNRNNGANRGYFVCPASSASSVCPASSRTSFGLGLLSQYIGGKPIFWMRER